MGASAMPALRKWRTVVQSDGTTIEIMQMGDEYYHYVVNREGKEVRLNDEGMYEVVGEAPTADKVKARRAANPVRKARKDVGAANLAPRGLLILVNFSNKTFKAANTKAVMDSLINAKDCKVNKYNNKYFGSAAQYFRDQSDGKYHPVFDVYGPVTLSNKYSYYGGNDSQGNDEYATDAVIEACIKANSQYSDLNFANYDNDGDGYVDFVYVIYAGYGEADYDDENTIWPHNYSIQEVVKYYSYGYTKYQKSQTKLDGKYLDNYAMSQELDGYYDMGSLAGNGTFCHEFGHVIGLPDYYDTEYSSNCYGGKTPNDWDVMDGGGYNYAGHCPPNYSAWEKYFFGWHTPINLGSEGQKLELIANGKEGYQAYQINTSGKQQAAAASGLCYYIENRQQEGWDYGLPSKGMLIWKVNYDQSKWEANGPNITSNGDPSYTIVSANSSKGIGTYRKSANAQTYTEDGPYNPFPQTLVTSWSGVSGKPLKDITMKNGVVSLIYIEEPVDPKYTVTWVVNGERLEEVEYAIDGTEDLKLPTKAVVPCDGTTFIGWTQEEEWADPFVEPEDLFTEASGKVTADVTYYALFQ